MKDVNNHPQQEILNEVLGKVLAFTIEKLKSVAKGFEVNEIELLSQFCESLEIFILDFQGLCTEDDHINIAQHPQINNITNDISDMLVRYIIDMKSMSDKYGINIFALNRLFVDGVTNQLIKEVYNNERHLH